MALTKREQSELVKLGEHAQWAQKNHAMLASVGVLARGYSCLARSTRSASNRNIIITHAAGVPAVVQHPDFIV